MNKERENDQSINHEREKENKQEDDNTGDDTPCRHNSLFFVWWDFWDLRLL